ncbi:NAD-dependent epimerase/dehydratase family protein [Fulvivirga sp. M361]|uniref:NAD-dependent epimerase/dehydratase family protein n=1 Tax=Fulvivirga sp. M361 TaxID=2594266 RepID=UPI00117ABB58|nr:NAD-dependent epimerase/dehydratase family protein [Fulvivirga sp. M361]TRX48195.1 NAD-dependent epimerase/dehydratase family protein [Fulvivirga sp. M361]
MILVTGANGLLGSFICKELLNSSIAFKALVRHGSDLTLLKSVPEERFVYADILDEEAMDEIMKQVEYVIHSAAIISFYQEDKDLMYRVNVLGTRMLINLALKHKIKHFVHISSVAALGRPTSSGVIDEKSKWVDSKWNNNYGESKYMAEIEVWRGLEENLKTVIINPSLVLGPGDWNRSSTRLFKYVWDEKKHYLNGRLNYVDARDVARIVKEVSAKELTGERYIVSAGDLSYLKFFQLVAKKLGRKAPYKQVGNFGIFMVLVLGKLLSVLTGKRPLVTKESIKSASTQISFSNAKIKNELNFNFTTLEETIEWTCKSFLNKYAPSK